MKKLLKQKTSTVSMIALVLYVFGATHLSMANGVVSDYRSGFLVTNPCVSKPTCSECLQTPTCAWCMKEVTEYFYQNFK